MNKSIAEIAIPISLSMNSIFDYRIPDGISPEIKIGCRVLVPFRNKKLIGYVIGLKNRSSFESKLKQIIKNLDDQPLINDELLKIALFIRNKYFCSIADAMHTVVPQNVKQSKTQLATENIRQAIFEKPNIVEVAQSGIRNIMPINNSILIHDIDNYSRWNIYSSLIRTELSKKKSVIFLVPDHNRITSALNKLKLKLNPIIISSHIKPTICKNSWITAMNSDFSFVLGTRSAVFTPVKKLGLIIIDEEDHFAYRQDQVPHYRTSEVAFERSRINDARLILGSFTPSLESSFLAKENKLSYFKTGIFKTSTEVKLIDMEGERRFKRRERIISATLEHYIADNLEKNKRILIFVNKKGFSTFLYCKKCKTTQTCQQCSSSLVYHYKTKTLTCPKCSFKSKAMDLCPVCKSSYIKYFGFGIEKVESELTRLFPSAKIKIFEDGNAKNNSCDIMLSTQAFLESSGCDAESFDVVAVLGCEQMLGALDFRATEKTFSKLLKLYLLAKQQLLIQTNVIDNVALKALQNKELDAFYDNELRCRIDSQLPPVVELGILLIRSKDQQKAKNAADEIYRQIKRNKSNVTLLGPTASVPFKLRGNFRYQILIKYTNLLPIEKKIRDIIEKPSSGIIITFDPSAIF